MSEEPFTPKRRLKACVLAWPECETFGYDPRCCRFPKSCSASVYDEGVPDWFLEPKVPVRTSFYEDMPVFPFERASEVPKAKTDDSPVFLTLGIGWCAIGLAVAAVYGIVRRWLR